MSRAQLYVTHQPLDSRLTIGLLHDHVRSLAPRWISLESRAWLLEREGRLLTGRLPGLEPLARELPEGLDDLPLLCASLYGEYRWLHFHDAHPLSQTPGQVITWSLDPIAGAEKIDGILCQKQNVLTWRDRPRFGLDTNPDLPETLDVERYYQHGKLVAWRLTETCTEVSK